MSSSVAHLQAIPQRLHYTTTALAHLQAIPQRPWPVDLGPHGRESRYRAVREQADLRPRMEGKGGGEGGDKGEGGGEGGGSRPCLVWSGSEAVWSDGGSAGAGTRREGKGWAKGALQARAASPPSS